MYQLHRHLIATVVSKKYIMKIFYLICFQIGKLSRRQATGDAAALDDLLHQKAQNKLDDINSGSEEPCGLKCLVSYILYI